MTLILRRVGPGNWSPLVLTYRHERQGQLPSHIEARVNARLTLQGVVYRVSKVLP